MSNIVSNIFFNILDVGWNLNFIKETNPQVFYIYKWPDRYILWTIKKLRINLKAICE